MDNQKRKILGSILGIVMFIICIIGLTFAWYRWKSSETNVNINIKDKDLIFTIGNDVNATNLTPVLDYMDVSNYGEEINGKYVAYTEFIANNETSSNKYYRARLNITKLDDQLKDITFKYSLLKKSVSDDYDKLICDGNFSSFTTGNNNIICDGIKVSSNTQENYRFVVYIDGNEKSDINMMNKSLLSTLIVEIDEDKSNVVAISLDNMGADTGKTGTATIYQRYGVGIFKDNTASTTEMTTSTNNITTPTKTGYTFKGYYTENNSNGEQLINNNGYITNLY